MALDVYSLFEKKNECIVYRKARYNCFGVERSFYIYKNTHFSLLFASECMLEFSSLMTHQNFQ